MRLATQSSKHWHTGVTHTHFESQQFNHKHALGSEYFMSVYFKLEMGLFFGRNNFFLKRLKM